MKVVGGGRGRGGDCKNNNIYKFCRKVRKSISIHTPLWAKVKRGIYKMGLQATYQALW